MLESPYAKLDNPPKDEDEENRLAAPLHFAGKTYVDYVHRPIVEAGPRKLHAMGPPPLVLKEVELQLPKLFPDTAKEVKASLERMLNLHAGVHNWAIVVVSISKDAARDELEAFSEREVSHFGPIVVDPSGATPEYMTFDNADSIKVSKERIAQANEQVDQPLIILYGIGTLGDRLIDKKLMNTKFYKPQSDGAKEGNADGEKANANRYGSPEFGFNDDMAGPLHPQRAATGMPANEPGSDANQPPPPIQPEPVSPSAPEPGSEKLVPPIQTEPVAPAPE